MRSIKVEELKDGMMFDMPVYIDGENLLVPPNIPIKQKDIDRLVKWDIDAIETEGKPVQAKGSAGLPGNDKGVNGKSGNKLMQILDAQADKELLEIYNESVTNLDTLFNDVKQNESGDPEKVNRIIDQLLPAVKDRKDEMISFLILSGHGESPLAESSVNSMIVSVFIAQSLRMTAHRINLLATASLLHDIGMMKIPDPVLQKKEKLTEKELKVIQTHPMYTYRIITKTLRFPEEVGTIALQHHERWDGLGYPKQLKGEDISLSARILSVADAFEAMVSVRPYRNSMIGYKAMRQLLNDNSRRFDSRILKTFIKIMGIYPIGSIVLLNDASIGRVTSTHSDAPLRPVIRLLVNAHGKTLESKKEIIDLMEHKKLFIAKAINPQEVELDN